MNIVRTFRALTAAAAVALPLLFAASPASAMFELRVPIGSGATCAGASCQSAGGGASLVLSNATLDFGSVAVLDTASVFATLSNIGTAAGAVTVSGPVAPFGLTHDCPATLAAQASCSVTFTFTPTAAGAASGSATVGGIPVTLGGFGDAINVKAVAAGAGSTVILKYDNTLWAIGLGSSGQLGVGTLASSTTFVQMTKTDGTPITGVARVAVGSGTHVVAITQDGSVWAVGANNLGQLGDGTFTRRERFVQMQTAGGPMSGVARAAVGVSITQLLKADGTVWAAGWNGYGGLGDGTTTNRSLLVPAKYTSGAYVTNAVAIAAGSGYSALVLADGTAWASGYGFYGQLGNGTANKTGFAQMYDSATGAGITGVVSVSAGDLSTGAHTVVLKQDGTVLATGYNSQGQLGDGTTTNRSRLVPMRLTDGTPITGVTAVSAGHAHTLVLGAGGAVWATGFNSSGQLGDGTFTNRQNLAPMFQAGGTAVTGASAVIGGNNTSFVILPGGMPWAAGNNYYGQLGDGTVANQWLLVPMQ